MIGLFVGWYCLAQGGFLGAFSQVPVEKETQKAYEKTTPIPRTFFSVFCGSFSFQRPKYRTFEMGIEVKFSQGIQPSPLMEIRPLVGIMANASGGGYGYGGVNFEFVFRKTWILAPGFATGYYWKGNTKDLGYPLEFRTGVELGYLFQSQHRLGGHFYHLSNAGIGKKNPGQESLVIYYSIPI